MRDIVGYLVNNYYKKYSSMYTPRMPEIEAMVNLCSDRTIVIRNPEIKCVAIYLTLTDETFAELTVRNINNVSALSELLKERGNNFHFVLLAAEGLKYIIIGMNEVKKRKPTTVSWWNPSMTRLHKYHLN